MLSPADAIGIASVTGVVIAAIIRFTPDKNGKYVRKEVFDTTVDAVRNELSLVHKDIGSINKKVDILLTRSN